MLIYPARTYCRGVATQESFSPEFGGLAVQVPLLWTVYLLLSFRDFAFLGPGREKDLSAQLFEVRGGIYWNTDVPAPSALSAWGTHASNACGVLTLAVILSVMTR